MKGHTLSNPTQNQIEKIRSYLLKKTRIDGWKIEVTEDAYESSWPQRPESIIDTLVIGATNVGHYNSKMQYEFDISNKNDVFEIDGCKGMTYHFFINNNGVIEQTSELTNLTTHTKTVNTRSLGIVIQYVMSSNSASPVIPVMQNLVKVLTMLCLKYKLNPYRAIKGRREVSFKWIPSIFTRGHNHMQNISPGILVFLDHLRDEVAVTLKRKLNAGVGGISEIKPGFDKEAKNALKRFDSSAVDQLFCKLKDDKTVIEDIETGPYLMNSEVNIQTKEQYKSYTD